MFGDIGKFYMISELSFTQCDQGNIRSAENKKLLIDCISIKIKTVCSRKGEWRAWSLGLNISKSLRADPGLNRYSDKYIT